MTSRTPRRHRRLALMAAGTAAAMVLVPGTALAQEAPVGDVLETLQEVAQSVTGTPGATGPEVPGLPGPGIPDPGAPDPGAPLPAAPELPGGSDDDSPGHETEDPEFPDHGSGYVGDVNLNEEQLLELVRYDATVEDDGSTHSDATLLGLLGDEIVGANGGSSSTEGPGETSDNLTEGLVIPGVLDLSLLYHDTIALQDDQGSFAASRGGILSLCLLGEDENVVTTYECEGLVGLGAAEGEAAAERDGKTGHTDAYSDNELLKACIAEGWTGFTCDGILGVSVLHSDSDSDSRGPETNRGSWLIGLDSGGEELLRIDEPTAVQLLECSLVLCLFLNQGESFIFDNGAGSAQEALHLDLLDESPIDVLVELGQAETIVHLESPEGCEPGEKGPCPTDKPECSDGIDNDGDGKIDADDPECHTDGDPNNPDSYDPHDDSEANGKKGDGAGDGGLADTGADIAPLLAGAFLLIGLGALTVAATRRRIGKHTV